MKAHRVPAGVPETPVRAYLQRAYPLLGEWAVREAIKNRDVRVNGERGAGMVRGGDEVALYLPDKFFSSEVVILYEDASLLVAEKPPLLPVDADRLGVGEDTLIGRLRAHCPGVQLAHRLDAGTGGALLAAKTEAAHAALLRAFAEGEIRKLYRAAAVGRHEGGRLLAAYLRKDASGARVTVSRAPSGNAKRILTKYQALEVIGEGARAYTRLSVELLTGRTHQIRAHLAFEGMPLVGDDKYGDRQANKALNASVPQLWCERLIYQNMQFESAPKGRFFTE